VAGDGVGVRSVVGDDLLAGPARRRAFAWALLALQRSYGTCSWSGESAHDGSIAVGVLDRQPTKGSTRSR
jgi:hypothetical protein